MDLSGLLRSEGVILLDGGMGTQLAKYGLEGGGQDCISNPQIVAKVHKEYLDSGSQLIITNTFSMNRVYIETHHLDIDVREVNYAGARIAKSVVSPGGQYVLGDIGPTGKMLKPYGEYSESEFYEAFKEQAGYLMESDVDGFIIETMFDLKEALCAVRACKDATSSIPVFASMTFSTSKNGGRTMMGNTAKECAESLTNAGARIIGINCGEIDVVEVAEIVKLFKQSTSLPILVEPNAGKPRMENNITVFDMKPDDFAEGVMECIENGARIVGGCCGTTPEHIRAIRKKIGR